MKKFIFKIIAFFLLVVLIITGYYGWLYLKKQGEHVTISKKNIIIGDSNTRWSIDDNILKNYANYSVGGETYLFAYTKLKILNRDNKIDTLILSFNPHNIINNMWWDDSTESPINNRMSAFYQNYTAENHLDIMTTIPKNYLKALMKIGREEAGSYFQIHPKKNNSLFRFGSYQPSIQNETQFKPVPYEYKKPDLTEIEIKYLNKIIEECKKKKIHLILVQTPKNYLRKDYKNYDHKEFYLYYKENLNQIDFLDFSKLKLPKHAYWDISHVDIVGAEYFSNFLARNGIKNLLNSPYNLKNDHR